MEHQNLKIEVLLNEMIAQQRMTLLKCGRRLVPQLVEDDLWQPNDFPILENNPVFRYEEGILAGYMSLQSALRAQTHTHSHSHSQE